LGPPLTPIVRPLFALDKGAVGLLLEDAGGIVLAAGIVVGPPANETVHGAGIDLDLDRPPASRIASAYEVQVWTPA
jgi:hypothetical protein